MTGKIVLIGGPTASGKSALALRLAERFGGEIISCDSVQVFRGFDIGSAKPSRAEQARIPHHMLDVLSWRDPCDAQIYATMASQAIDAVHARGRLPIVVGGTGLYFRALTTAAWHGNTPKDEALRTRLRTWPKEKLWEFLWRLDARRANELHVNDQFRVVRALEILLLTGRSLLPPEEAATDTRFYSIFLHPERTILHERIAARVAVMLGAGLIAETQALLDEGCPRDVMPMRSIGYAQAAAFLAGELRESDLLRKIVEATRQYAKRQITWFKGVTHDVEIKNPDDLSKIQIES